MPCPCGGTAARVIDWGGHCIVRGVERPFKLDATSAPIGWERGNTAEAQEARYSRLIEKRRKAARANDKQAIKGGIRSIASVPRELVRERSKQYGKDYFDPTAQSAGELKEKLKSDGLLFHRN